MFEHCDDGVHDPTAAPRLVLARVQAACCWKAS
eukprot:CAMPEP_0180796518 /NCGR_PEP_ID=MMETSP1038_2-20121128/56835_1 /TAXON_ID=632150 /ORGANISM="Azadinium spinosum, Strain 3D9" /LENGTH=32 /DNA_ID= /DNA_START= /DNA_END= /DNA_ORIENTATION=